MARLKQTLPIGAELVKRNIISNSQLQQALELQKRSRKQLDVVLLELNLVDELVLSRINAESLGFDFVDIENYLVDPEVARLIPENISRRHNLIVINKILNTLTVAMADPINIIATDDIHLLTGLRVKVVVAPRTAIQEAIQNAYRRD